MDKLTGVIEMEEHSIPFFMNDFVFDFTTIDIDPLQHLLPAETVKTAEEFVTGWTHGGYFIAIYTGQDSFRTNATSSVHTCMYITSKNNASDIWCGEPFDGMLFCGGCIDKVYQGRALVPQENIFVGDKITLLRNKDTVEFDFLESENCVHALFSTNVNISQSFDNGLSIKEDGKFLRLLFDSPQTLGNVPKIIGNVRSILSFLIFRNNLSCNKIYLTKKDENGRNILIAEVHIEQNNPTNKNNRNCLSVNLFQDHLSSLFTTMFDSKIGTMSYIPEKDSESNMIKAVEIKEICSALEYEIDHTDGLLSDEDKSLNVLIDQIKTIVKEHRDSDNPLPERTYDLIFGSMSHWSQSLTNQIVALRDKHAEAISKCEEQYRLQFSDESIASFVKYRNNTSHGDVLELSQGIAETAIMLKCLIYCNVLSRVGMNETEIAAICENIYFIDDDFLFNPERIRKFVELIKARNIKKKYVCYGRADFIASNEELMKSLKEIGLYYVLTGLESTSDDYLDSYNKRIDMECNIKAINITNNLGINMMGMFITDLDFEAKDFSAIYKFARKYDIKHVAISIYTPEFDSKLYKDMGDRIITDNPEHYDYLHVVARPGKLSLRSYYFHYHILMVRLFLRAYKDGIYSFLDYGYYVKSILKNMFKFGG